MTGSPAELAEKLTATGYLCDESLATVAFLALELQRPLLVEGEPGTGKTALAEALAQALDAPLIRLQCYEGIDASQALYDWDFPRQILHLRAVESVGSKDLAEVESGLFAERFLLERPILQALRQSPAVLLVDEIDRADDEFEAFLLEVLSTYQVSIPELGTIEAKQIPLVFLTSNNTRELSEALKRRCLYLHVDYPDMEREKQIVLTKVPGVTDALADQVARIVRSLRQLELKKSPSVSESIDWARTLLLLGVETVDAETATSTANILLKYQSDIAKAVKEFSSDQNAAKVFAPGPK
jgi:MoxR-like ATPase